MEEEEEEEEEEKERGECGGGGVVPRAARSPTTRPDSRILFFFFFFFWQFISLPGATLSPRPSAYIDSSSSSTCILPVLYNAISLNNKIYTKGA